MLQNNMDINNIISNNGCYSINEVLSKAIDKIHNVSANKDGISGIPTGYTNLDEITSGFQNGDLITIAGRPSLGKTSFALSIAKNVAVDYKIPTLFFSLEMNSQTIVKRLLSNVCEIQALKLLSGQLQKEEWTRLDKFSARLKDAPLFVDDTSRLSKEELSNRARRSVSEDGVKLIIIDYLQMLATPYRSNRSRHDELAEIMFELKALARELDIPIIILSQLNRAIEDRQFEEKSPLLSDLRECGAIEEVSDIVIFVHRPEYYKIYVDNTGKDLRKLAQIMIAKHRLGFECEVTLAFKREYMKFENQEEGTPPYIP